MTKLIDTFRKFVHAPKNTGSMLDGLELNCNVNKYNTAIYIYIYIYLFIYVFSYLFTTYNGKYKLCVLILQYSQLVKLKNLSA